MMFINDAIYKIYERWIAAKQGLLKGEENDFITVRSVPWTGPSAILYLVAVTVSNWRAPCKGGA